jgi:hypothetical protein
MKALATAARVAAASAVLAASAAAIAGPEQQTAGSEPQTVEPSSPSSAAEEIRRCPVGLRGASFAIRQTTGGVTVELRSSRLRQVSALRDQLRDIALVVESYSRAPIRGVAMAPERSRLPPLDVQVDDVQTGVRVIIRPVRPRDLPELLDLARALELFWWRSDCSEDLRARGLRALPTVQA